MAKDDAPRERVVDTQRLDAVCRETIRKEMRTNATTRKLTDADRVKAISGLNAQLRPRMVNMPRSSSVASRLPAAATMARLSIGDSVQLAGLRSRGELNGHFGEVVHDIPDSEGRIRIKLKKMRSEPRLPNGDEPVCRVMRVKKGNLQTMGWTAQASAADEPNQTWQSEMRRTWSVGDVPAGPAAPFSLGTSLMPLPPERRGFRRSVGGRFNSSGLSDELRVGESVPGWS